MSNKEIPMRGKSLNQENLQVAGEFQCGDEHPNFEELVYLSTNRNLGKQRWVTKECLEGTKNQRREAQRAKYSNDPKHAKAERKRKCKYAKANPELGARRIAKRRAIMREHIANLTLIEEKMIEQYYIYASRLTQKLKNPFHVDHIIPVSRGGLHTPDNLQVVPAKWNLRKNNRNTEKWQPSPI